MAVGEPKRSSLQMFMKERKKNDKLVGFQLTLVVIYVCAMEFLGGHF